VWGEAGDKECFQIFTDPVLGIHRSNSAKQV
jgi:hypothetical protein